MDKIINFSITEEIYNDLLEMGKKIFDRSFKGLTITIEPSEEFEKCEESLKLLIISLLSGIYRELQ